MELAKWSLLLALPLGLGLQGQVKGQTVDWGSIDRLRALLQRSGVQVVQRNCQQQGLQGLYHQVSDTIVICRVHRDPAAVWNTLAHEATHRMQACRGGSITAAAYHRSMALALNQRDPNELRSLRLYPAGQRLSELEARYTAQLPAEQVLRLFQHYCGRPSPPSLAVRSPGDSQRIQSFASEP